MLPGRTTLLLLAAAALPAAPRPGSASGPRQDEPAPGAPAAVAAEIPPAQRAAWLERDEEARWVFHQTRVAPADARAWAAFLAERGEYELLERIAVAGTRATDGALEALAAVDAPRWIRTAAWLVEDRDPRVRERALAALRARPGKALGWLALFPAERRGALERLAAELEADGAVATEASAYLGPLDEKAAFGPLEPGPADEPVVALGDAPRAEPGVRYRHQVTRAVEALLRRRARPETALERLARLVARPEPALRRAALAALERLDPAEIAVEPLLAILDAPPPADVASADDAPATELPAAELPAAELPAAEAPTAREAALAALALAPDARAWPALLERVRDADHPARVAVAVALAARDDGYLPAVLAAEPPGPVPAGVATTPVALGTVPAVAAAAAELRARLAARDAEAWSARVPALLERAARADLDGRAWAADVTAWTLARLAELAPVEPVHAALRALAEGDDAIPAGADAAVVPAAAAPLRVRVAELARRVLAE